MKSLILGLFLVFASTAATTASAGGGCYHPHRHCAHYGYGYASHYYTPTYKKCGYYRHGCHYHRYCRSACSSRCSNVVYYYPYRAYHGYYYSPNGWYWGRW